MEGSIKLKETGSVTTDRGRKYRWSGGKEGCYLYSGGRELDVEGGENKGEWKTTHEAHLLKAKMSSKYDNKNIKDMKP